MTTNKHLRELAEGVKHWGNSVADAWPSDPDYNDTWSAGAIDGDGNKYPVLEVDADQYDAPGDSERLARFFTAANPATVLALMDEIDLLRDQLDALAEYKLAAHQLIGIPASVGISEPIEGFAKRPQDIMPAVRGMALRIELLEHQAAERDRLLAESRADAQAYFDREIGPLDAAREGDQL